MAWLVKTVSMMIALWIVMFYGYGTFGLTDSVIPNEFFTVEEWIETFIMICGFLSGFAGLVCSGIWYWRGNNYSGGSGITIVYYGLWVLSLVLGLGIAFLVLPITVDGSGFASTFITIFPPILYYLSSVFAYADPVKYIPPLAEQIYK